MGCAWKVILYVVLYVVGSLANADTDNPDHTYEYQAMRYLLKYKISTNYNGADKLCKDNNAVLPHVSRRTFERARRTFRTHIRSGRTYWVDLRNQNISKVYNWRDGTKYNPKHRPSFLFFAEQNKECVAVRIKARRSFAFFSKRCNEMAEVICIIDDRLKRTPKRSRRADNFKYFSMTTETNLETKWDYDGARKLCEDNNLELAHIEMSIQPEAERQLLQIIKHKQYFWIDFKRRDGEKKHSWPDGTTDVYSVLFDFGVAGLENWNCSVVWKLNATNTTTSPRPCENQHEVMCMTKRASSEGSVGTTKTSLSLTFSTGFPAYSETTILSTGTVINAGAAAIRSIAGLVLLLAVIIGCIVYKKRHSKKKKLEEKGPKKEEEKLDDYYNEEQENIYKDE